MRVSAPTNTDMGATGSIPEDRKAVLGGKVTSAFRRAVEMFELDPEGMLIMMKCIITETEDTSQTLALYLKAEEAE